MRSQRWPPLHCESSTQRTQVPRCGSQSGRPEAAGQSPAALQSMQIAGLRDCAHLSETHSLSSRHRCRQWCVVGSHTRPAPQSASTRHSTQRALVSRHCPIGAEQSAFDAHSTHVDAAEHTRPGAHAWPPQLPPSASLSPK